MWIATPNALHAEHSIIAAECGKHVIVEKPMAVTLDEADRMIAAAERNRVKLVQGYLKIYGPAIKKIREVIHSGRLGHVIQIDTWNYNDWLQRRPRLASEVDTHSGGGVCFRQGPHQVDIVRYLGGGMAKSIRATTGRADKNFATEGNYTAFLEFDDGTPASMVFNGYGYFDIAELTWGADGKQLSDTHAKVPSPRLMGPVDQHTKYNSPSTSGKKAVRKPGAQSVYGLTVVGCERGVIRQSPQGIYVYSEAGREEIACPADDGPAAVLRELQQSIAQNRPAFPDGRWGKATLEVCLAMLQSSNERREITLAHQVPVTEIRDQQEACDG